MSNLAIRQTMHTLLLILFVLRINDSQNAEALKNGFREIGKSLGGTRAELMMDVLLKQSEVNGGKIPEPGSEEWNKCKEIAKQVLKEFSDEK